MAESEFILLRRFAGNGDAEAFAQIVKQHAPFVYGVCLRILENKDNAADAVQETFLQLVRDAAEITGSLPNWLHRVAKNRSIELIRHNSSIKQREQKYAADFEKRNVKKETVTWRKISCCIDEELDKLDDLTREVIILHFLEGQKMTDIAEKFGISQPTVSRRVESGIDSLRDRLKSRGVIVPAAILATLLNENIVQAAPASIMRELGKIAIVGSKAATGATISTGIAIKAKIVAVSTAAIFTIGSVILYINYTLAAEPQKTAHSTPVAIDIPEVSELLAKYTQALESTKSFISKSEFTSTSVSDLGQDAPAPELIGYKKETGRFEISEIRYDGERTHIRKYNWNEPNPPEESRTRDKAGDFRLNNFANGENYRHSMTINTEGYGGLVMVNKTEFYAPGHEQIMMGKFFSDDKRVDEVLGKATNLSVRPATEKIGDSECYVLDAQTMYGKFSIWIDPDHGYQMAKVEQHAKEGDFMTPDTKFTKGQSNSRIYNYGKFEQFDGIWVPMEYESYTEHIFGPDGYSKGEGHFKRTEFVLNPDHDALGSFDSPLRNPENDPEFINGNPVQIAYLNKRFEWQDGKLLDENGEVFDIDNIKPVSLLGKALPKFTEVRLNPDIIKNRMLLVCFWNMDNVSSCNTIRRLNKRAEALLDTNDLYIVFIHAGALPDKTFHSWLLKYKILPPAGYSTVRLDGLQYRWGVKSVPWLILTDEQHIVTDEGFSITELDEKLGSN